MKAGSGALLPIAILAATSSCLAQTAVALKPGGVFTVQFAEMPPTFYDLFEQKGITAQMTVCLPRNYDVNRTHPLLVFLNGWDGGAGTVPRIARSLCEDQDFVCVGVPLFKSPGSAVVHPNAATVPAVIADADGQYMWPFFKTMLARLDQLVPNIDPAHRVLGGSSNGAHAVAALVNQSEGEVARAFSAFFLVDGGGGLRSFELLKDKPLLMVCGVWRPNTQAPIAAGVRLTVYRMANAVHAFPETEYPAVREWLRGPAMQ